MEKYRDGWKRVVLMVSPSGEFRAIGGNRAEGEGDTEFLGMTPLQNRIAALEAQITEMRTYSHETVKGLVDWRDERIAALEADLAQAKAEIAEWQKEGARRSRIIDERTAERDLARAENDEYERNFSKRESHWIRENGRLQVERDSLRSQLEAVQNERNTLDDRVQRLEHQLEAMSKPVSESPIEFARRMMDEDAARAKGVK